LNKENWQFLQSYSFLDAYQGGLAEDETVHECLSRENKALFVVFVSTLLRPHPFRVPMRRHFIITTKPLLGN
jgi:hypothetical protein